MGIDNRRYYVNKKNSTKRHIKDNTLSQGKQILGSFRSVQNKNMYLDFSFVKRYELNLSCSCANCDASI